MSDNPTERAAATEGKSPKSKNSATSGTVQLLLDLGPVAVFVIAYNLLNKSRPEDAIYIATGLFIVATLAAIAWTRIKRGKVPPVLIVTGVLVTAFGGLTIVLHDDLFLKVKPTVINFFYAGSILVSVLIGKNLWKLLFGHAFSMPDRIWNVLALRWAGFFVVLALLNEFIWRTTSTEFWVNAKLTIMTPLMFGFMLLNAPLVFKHADTGETKDTKTPAQADVVPEKHD